MTTRLVVIAVLLAMGRAVAPEPTPVPTIKEAHRDADAPMRPADPTVEIVTLKPQPTPVPSPKPKLLVSVLPKTPVGIQYQLIDTFKTYIGIKENPPGSNNGPLIDKFNQLCGFAPKDHAPWCASVKSFGYHTNGLPFRGAYSPSWFAKARKIERDDVQVGDSAVVFYPSMGRYGHTICAIWKVERHAGRVTTVYTYEGNTFGMGKAGSREGDQFAWRVRGAGTITFVRWWRDPA